MKFLQNLIRFFVSIVFILSGWVKINDLTGFSFKLEEYFSQGVFNLPFLSSYTLFIATAICLSEIILGIFLLCGYKTKIAFYGLFTLEIFFAFLTFYSAYYNKVTDCGCFGDAIKFTPWQSFFKDILLFVLTLIIFFYRNNIFHFHKKISKIIIIIVIFSSLVIAFYSYHHLPIVDFRPYKIGVNIEQGMSIPPNAPKPIIEYVWTFEKNKEKHSIKTFGNFPEFDGDFIGVETKQISKGYTPPIHDFSIEKESEDFTEDFLHTPKLILIVSYNVHKSEKNAWNKIQSFALEAKNKGYTVIGLTASDKFEIDSIPFYFCDETTLKTMIRSNPGIVILENGTIKNKIHHNDITSFKL